MGLGPANIISLKDARQRAQAARRLILDGTDPIDLRKAGRSANAPTFRQVAERYVAAHEAGWKNEVHRQQWRSTLKNYCYPALGNLPITAIDTDLVLKVLEPIWRTKPETASRVRGRIEAVWDSAKAQSQCSGENPARWRGHLKHLLPARSKVQRVKHHAALPYMEVPALMKELNTNRSPSAFALMFTILTAARTTEARAAKLSEFDQQARVWTVPADRMKSGRPHRVPLSDTAMSIVITVGDLISDGEYLFPGVPGEGLSQMAMAELLKGMRRGVTVHGFRSSFRDWAAEKTTFPREVAEAALAHVLSDKTEAAYQRGDLFEKRRELMAAWAKFLSH